MRGSLESLVKEKKWKDDPVIKVTLRSGHANDCGTGHAGRFMTPVRLFIGALIRMSFSFAIVVFALVLALAVFLLIGAIRTIVVRAGWFDLPNQRRSHSNPTPRSGGVAIVSVALAGPAVG